MGNIVKKIQEKAKQLDESFITHLNENDTIRHVNGKPRVRGYIATVRQGDKKISAKFKKRHQALQWAQDARELLNNGGSINDIKKPEKRRRRRHGRSNTKKTNNGYIKINYIFKLFKLHSSELN